jgi:hypothetical protein
MASLGDPKSAESKSSDDSALIVHGQFKFSEAAILMLGFAIQSKLQGDFNFSLRGTVAERARQSAQLIGQGVAVGRLAEGGALTKKDLPEALKIIWNFKPTGWHRYQDLLCKHRVCSEDEFAAALNV